MFRMIFRDTARISPTKIPTTKSHRNLPSIPPSLPIVTTKENKYKTIYKIHTHTWKHLHIGALSSKTSVTFSEYHKNVCQGNTFLKWIYFEGTFSPKKFLLKNNLDREYRNPIIPPVTRQDEISFRDFSLKMWQVYPWNDARNVWRNFFEVSDCSFRRNHFSLLSQRSCWLSGISVAVHSFLRISVCCIPGSYFLIYKQLLSCMFSKL